MAARMPDGGNVMTRLALVIFALLLAFAAPAAAQKKCDEGQALVNGKCVVLATQICRDDADCGPRARCIGLLPDSYGGLCVPDLPRGGGAAGGGSCPAGTVAWQIHGITHCVKVVVARLCVSNAQCARGQICLHHICQAPPLRPLP